MINTTVCRLVRVQAARCSCIRARAHTHTCTHSRLDDAVPAWAPSRGDSSQAKVAAPLSWGLLSAHSILPFDSFPSPTPFKAHPQSPHTMPRNLYGVSTGCRMKGSPDHQEKW